MISQARLIAHAILTRVETNSAWANELLFAGTADLDRRDAGLAAEIVYGCLRRQTQLDFVLAQTSGRDPAKWDTAVRVALRMGAYQLRHLDRVPAHAVVNDSVALVKKARKTSASALVNAVLRKLPTGLIDWPSPEIALCQPAWLLDRWNRQFGPPVAEKIAKAFLQAPETYLRLPPVDRPGLHVEPTDVPGAFRLLSGNATGLRLQDIGSQTIVPLLDLGEGHRFLDLCSAPGNKTAQALETPNLKVVACDIHHHRLRQVSGCPRTVADATQPLPFAGVFDRILVDAPCSGTGTLGRNPEIRWTLQPSDISELQNKQIAILRSAFCVLKPGGRLIYSTCSLEREENEDVVAAVASHQPFKLLAEHRRTPGLQPGDGFYAAVLIFRDE